MKSPIVRLMLLAAALVACSDVTEPAVPAHGVVVALQVPGRCLVTCDPVPNQTATTALVTLRNTGPATAYLEHCGSRASLTEQQFVGGKWIDVGPAITASCVVSGPLTIAPGDSLQLNWFFERGIRRLVLGVGSQESLSDEAFSYSASVDVK